MTNGKPSPEPSSRESISVFTTKMTDNGINAFVKITLAAFEEAPPWLKIFGIAMAFASISAVLFGFGFFFSGAPSYALISLFLAIGLLVLVVIIMRPTIPNAPSTLSLIPQDKILFSHVVIKITETKSLTPLGNDIEEIRLACLEKIRNLHPELGVENNAIRGNVFMPDFHSAGRHGCAFHLYMPAELRREMNYVKEHGIILLPGDGVTGTVFIEGSQKIVAQDEFPLRDIYKKDLHPDLKWVISTPMKSLNGATVLAVLNIDVLRYELKEGDFQVLGPLINGMIRKLEEKFDKFEKVGIHILKKESSQAP